jgi:ABC-type glycerol-3-phosphate transport system substrate-binding protein
MVRFKKNKMVACLLLSLLLAFSAVACSSSTAPTNTSSTTPPADTSSAPGTSATPAESTPPNDNPVIGTTNGSGGYKERGGDLIEFSIARPVWNNPTYEKGNPYEQALFAAGNVKIDTTFAKSEDYDSMLVTLMAGGTDIDVIWHRGPGREISRQFMDDGAFQPIDEWLDKYPALKEVNFSGAWDLTTEADGSHLFFPNPTDPFTNFPLYYRADLVEKANIALPHTTDEFVTFLAQIHEAYPEIAPLSCFVNKVEFLFANLYNAFGSNHNWSYDASSDRITHYVTTPQYIDSMSYMHDLRVQGLLDPDFMIADGMGADKFVAGNAAVVSAQWWWVPSASEALRKNVPDGVIGALPTLTGPNGDKTGSIGSKGYDWGFSINAKTPKEKVDKIFEYLNWLYTDGYEINYQGFESKNFTRNDDGTYTPIADDVRDLAWDVANIEPLQFPQKTYTLYPNWLEVYNTIMAMTEYPDDLKLSLVETVRTSYEEGAKNIHPNYDKDGYSATSAEIGAMILDPLLAAEAKILIDPTASIQILIDAQSVYMSDGGQKIQDEVNAATPDKTVGKIEYKYTGQDYR